MTKKRRDSSASIHQRLLNKARSTGEPFEAMLTRFTLERLLYRLSKSPFSNEFLLKGAMLFALWADQPYRPTRDLDMLGFGSADPQRLTGIFRELCARRVQEVSRPVNH
ncbi:MAG: nucleotidyl transferase AbiEii/AbiGii toxin family protein [Planctomycetota bacterium]